MSERRAEKVTPMPVSGLTLCVCVPVATIELIGQLVAAGWDDEALSILRALRNGPRRLERVWQ